MGPLATEEGMAPGQSNFGGYLSDMKTSHAICFVCQKRNMFRISEVNVSEMTFRISFRISEMVFGYVMTLRLTGWTNLVLSANLLTTAPLLTLHSRSFIWIRSTLVPRLIFELLNLSLFSMRGTGAVL